MSGGIDFSDEALEARLVDSEYEPAVANELEADEESVPVHAREEAPAEEELVDGQPPVEAEASAEPAATEDPTPDPIPEPNEWQQRYQELQSAYGRQGSEVGELRQQLAQIQSLMLQQQAAPADTGHVDYDMDQLLDYAVDNPDDAFDFALNEAPEAIPAVLAEIRAHDPQRAEAMTLFYAQQQQEQVLNERLQQMEQRLIQQTAPLTQYQAQVAQASSVDAVAQQYADWDQHKDAVAEVIRTQGATLFAGSTPADIQRGVQMAYFQAKAARADALLQAQSLQQQTLQQQAAGSTVVQQGNQAPPPEPKETTLEDSIHDGIFEANSRVVW